MEPITEKKQVEKKQPVKYRGLPLEVNDHLIDQVNARFKGAKSPILLASYIVGALGYVSLDAFDRAARRAERFVRNHPTRRLPSHLRDKLITNQVVQKCVAKRFSGKKGRGKQATAVPQGA